ncbi:MAG TPA: hypothetical protein VI136_20450 [Verrucomicrobiae bacterium]
MNKRLLWGFASLCGLAVVTLLLVPSSLHQSSPRDTDEPPPQTSTEGLTEVARLDLPAEQSSDGSDLMGTGDEPRDAASMEAATPKPPSHHLDHLNQRAARAGEPTLAMRQPETATSQDAGWQAEVWSYPPLLQQNASNNFVRAMERLANAKTEFERYRALGSAAKSDFVFGRIQDARNYATELLSLDERFEAEPWRDGSAVYDANLVLGRIAAKEGKLDEARQYLLEAGKSTGSPVLRSFGPNMSLARDLVQHGERDAVLEYFELCRKFWTMGSEKLTRWSEDVKAGRMPDFGANLFY